MSQGITGRVFDASTRGWIADVIVSGTIAGYATTTYVNAQLALRDASILVLFTENDAQDVSIAWLDNYRTIQDASIASLESDLGNYTTLTYVDGSLALRDVSIAWLDNYRGIQDASIAANAASLLDIDTSIGQLDTALAGKLDTGLAVLEASLGGDFVWNAGYLDVSITATDGSVADLYLRVETLDTSVAANASDIDDVSTRVDANETLLVIHDASIGANTAAIAAIDASGVSKVYVDGSLAARDIEIGQNTSDISDVSTRMDTAEGDITNLDTSISTLEGLISSNTSDIADVSTRMDTAETTIGNIDTSLGQIDTALAGKQDTIADGTYVKEASLGDGLVWVSGQLDVSVAGGGVTDLSVGGLTDVSANNPQTGEVLIYNETTGLWYAGDPQSIEDHNDLLGIQGGLATQRYHLNLAQYNYLTGKYPFLTEASIGDGLVWVAGQLDVSVAVGGDVTQAYVDGSLATRDTEISQNASDIADVSARVYTNETDISDVSTRVNTAETDIGNLDTSIGALEGLIAQNTTDIDDVSTRIPTDFYSQAYVDGSLNAKQDTITDGTYVKEASLGDGLYWVSGQLDVSVAGGGGGATALSQLTDVSIVDVSTADGLMYEDSLWKNKPTTDIADVATDIADILVDAGDYFYSIEEIDASFALKADVDASFASFVPDVSVKGAYNIDQAGMDASVYKGLDASGNLMFKKLGGTGAIDIVEYDDYIDINIDASFSGEVNTASNTGEGIGFYKEKVLEDLVFKGLYTSSAELVISSSDNVVVIDASIDYASTLSGLTDVTITDVSTDDALMYSGAVWENKPTTAIEDVATDIADILVDAGDYFYTIEQVDASFALITSLDDYATIAYVDASFALKTELLDVSIADASNNDTLVYQNGYWEATETVDVSALFYTQTQIDASFALISSLDDYLPLSGGAIAGALEINGPITILGGMDVSIEAGVDVYIPGFAFTSLPTAFFNTIFGYVEFGDTNDPVSGDYNSIYIYDGIRIWSGSGDVASFEPDVTKILNAANFADDVSIVGDLYVGGVDIGAQDASIEDLYDIKANTLLALNEVSTGYTVTSGDIGGLVEMDASATVTLPDSLDAGFTVNIINIGTGYVTLEASTLYTTDSSVQLRDQYAGATAIHKGSGTWYAFGNLKG